MEHKANMRRKLAALYGDDAADAVLAQLLDLLPDHPAPRPAESFNLSEQDVILITYGDQLQRASEAPLQTLHHFGRGYLADIINSVHILPFYPYSSDDGFSVIDYYAVDDNLGDWTHIQQMSADFRLMFDAVFNHISAQSDWFKGFLNGQAPYTGYFTVVDPGADLSAVVRPRALPLLTPVETPSGTQHVWTTFSDDQIDLNYANPALLLEMVRVLLFYLEQGARLIRLDAIAFIWKEIGTGCIHLDQVHTIVQLMRDVLEWVAPGAVLITETNVPHEENISYFGDGTNEAQMVYQFPLPPLLLHTLTAGDTTALNQWARSLEQVSDQTTFFNFTASHDGIGVRPVTGLLSQAEIDALVKVTLDHGGHVSYRNMPDGTQQPYELNITYFDAITHPDITAEQPDIAVKRFLVSQAMMLALAGVPGIYFHSLFGSRNHAEGVAQTGRYRSINRQKLGADTLLAELKDAHSIRSKVWKPYRHLIHTRTQSAAFHPLAKQMVLDLSSSVFALERITRDGAERILALHNVTGNRVSLQLDFEGAVDLLTDEPLASGDVTLEGYQVAWLRFVER